MLALAMMGQLEVGTNQERALDGRGRQTIERQEAKPNLTNPETEWLAGLLEPSLRPR